MNKFVSKAVLVGGDPFTKEEKFCQPSIKGGKETCSDGDGYGFGPALRPCREKGSQRGVPQPGIECPGTFRVPDAGVAR